MPKEHRPKPIAADKIRAAVRKLCADCCGPGTDFWDNHYMDCYRLVKDYLGLKRSFRSRDSGLVASECNRIRSGYYEKKQLGKKQ